MISLALGLGLGGAVGAAAGTALAARNVVERWKPFREATLAKRPSQAEFEALDAAVAALDRAAARLGRALRKR